MTGRSIKQECRAGSRAGVSHGGCQGEWLSTVLKAAHSPLYVPASGGHDEAHTAWIAPGPASQSPEASLVAATAHKQGDRPLAGCSSCSEK